MAAFLIILPSYTAPEVEGDWGFYAHREINRMAVFTLPPELMSLYKDKIEWISEHAVDPDKRRYATEYEAIRHYIDIDVWGEYPFPNMPRGWTEAIASFAQLHWISPAGDTVQLVDQKYPSSVDYWLLQYKGNTDTLSSDRYLEVFRHKILPGYYGEDWTVDSDSLSTLSDGAWTKSGTVSVRDTFSQHGVLPWHMQQAYNQLVNAFQENDIKEVLRLSADFGHYIGDAHVPLHTTKNYDGQLSNQVGIHAFWESRIPELFAEDHFDYFVGKAEYIRDEQAFFWERVLESHQLVDSVLAIEKRLSQRIPEEKQFCYEERLSRTVRTQCKAYANAFRKAMSGMVERRMREAIHATGSLWYSAWVDAGQPSLADIDMNYDYRTDSLPSGTKRQPVRQHDQ